MFYKEFVRLCEENDQTPTGAAKAMGLAGAHVNKWKNGSTPTDLSLLKICNYFHLPPDYFDKFFVKSERKEKSPTPDGVGLDEELIMRLCQLTPDEIQKVDAFVQGLLASR